MGAKDCVRFTLTECLFRGPHAHAWMRPLIISIGNPINYPTGRGETKSMNSRVNEVNELWPSHQSQTTHANQTAVPTSTCRDSAQARELHSQVVRALKVLEKPPRVPHRLGKQGRRRMKGWVWMRVIKSTGRVCGHITYLLLMPRSPPPNRSVRRELLKAPEGKLNKKGNPAISQFLGPKQIGAEHDIIDRP